MLTVLFIIISLIIGIVVLLLFGRKDSMDFWIDDDGDIRFMTRFIYYFYFISWTGISLGFHIDFAQPNIEIHLPFGFIRIGWVRSNEPKFESNEEIEEYIDKRTFGKD